MHGVYDSAGPLRTRDNVRSRVAFWRTDAIGDPDQILSKLNTQPTDSPVQRFECDLTAAPTWLGARVDR
jgi:hypothetical protein